MKKIRKQIILLMLTMITVLISVSACSAADLTVGPGGYANIQSAYNAANENGDTIIVTDGNYSRTDNSQIFINKNINITGQSQTGTIINGENENNFFTIAPGRTVTIKSLTLVDGGDTNAGGAINNAGTLNLIDCAFISNEADELGGAIFNTGALTVTGCTFTGNKAIYGGAIENEGFTFNVIESIFTDNTAPAGGAIRYMGAIGVPGTLTRCIFTNNSAEEGGAVYAMEPTLTITGCNFNKNTAGWGGALFFIGENRQTSNTVKYSRFVGNTAITVANDIYYSQWLGPLNARYNWWGSNSGPGANRLAYWNGEMAVNLPSTYYDPWLMLNIYAIPSTIYTGQTSKVTADVYTDSDGVDHSADAAQFFSGPEVKFTTNLGNVGSKSVTVPWALGMAFAILRGDEGPGIATVTAADGEIKSTTVTILQAPEVEAADTIGMQKTGLPIAGLILAILALFGGLITSKRN